MAKHSNISWCDSTLGLSAGCSDGCCLAGRSCYAETLCKRMAGRKGFPKDFRKPELFLYRLDEALRWKDLTGTDRPNIVDKLSEHVIVRGKPWLDGMPRMIFCCDLGDPFDRGLPEDWPAKKTRRLYRSGHALTKSVLEWMSESPHVYIFLTKQAERMADFSQRYPFPKNVWVGVSVTSADTLGRVEWLLRTVAYTRIISFEPLLGPVDHTEYLPGADGPVISRIANGRRWPPDYGCPQISGIIIGGESGPKHRPCKIDWIRSLADQAKAAGCAVFIKQDSHQLPGQQGRIPDDLWNLKEIPHGEA